MSQTVRKLLGQNLLVYFENYLEVHVKVYVKIVYSWFSWNQKGRKQSRDCWVGTCSCTSRAISRCTCSSRPTLFKILATWDINLKKAV